MSFAYGKSSSVVFGKTTWKENIIIGLLRVYLMNSFEAGQNQNILPECSGRLPERSGQPKCWGKPKQ